MTLSLWDTAGQDEYGRIRPHSYKGTHVFVVCYAVDNVTSYRAVETKWLSEIKEHSPHVPFILCCTKIDLRKDPLTLNALSLKGEKPLTLKDGEEMRKKIGAETYVEVSALTREGISKVFQAAVIAAINGQDAASSKSKNCSIQ